MARPTGLRMGTFGEKRTAGDLDGMEELGDAEELDGVVVGLISECAREVFF